MSDAQEMSLFEQLKQQHAQFVAQRDQIQVNFQQLLGAIAACEIMIKNHEEELKKQEKAQEDVQATPKEPEQNGEDK